MGRVGGGKERERWGEWEGGEEGVRKPRVLPYIILLSPTSDRYRVAIGLLFLQAFRGALDGCSHTTSASLKIENT